MVSNWYIILTRNAAAVVGILWLSWVSLKILKFFVEGFHAFVLAPWGILRTNLKKYGQWAGELIYPISLFFVGGGGGGVGL